MTALNLSIHKPLTIEAIQQSERAYIRKNRRYLLLLLILTAAAGLSLAGAILIGGPWISSIWLITSLLLLLATGGIVHLKQMNFDVVPESDCARLLEACMATPEGQTYRAAVLAQGRKFLELEMEMIYAWTNKLESRTACKKLYDISV